MEFKKQIDDLQLSRLGLAAEKEFYQSMAIDQLDCKGITAFTLGVAESDLNLVIDTQISHQEAVEKIDEVIRFFVRHQVDWRWVIGPLSNPKDLHHHLEKKGFVREANSPGMYMDLDANDLPITRLRNWEIREVSTDDDFSEWGKIIAEAFPDRNHSQKYQLLNARIPHGHGNALRHYMGYYQNEPVSIVTLFISSQSVMLHNLATKKKFCRRGFGKKMMLFALAEAKKKRFKHCFLEASEKGFQIYQRIGFRVYCVYKVYRPPR